MTEFPPALVAEGMASERARIIGLGKQYFDEDIDQADFEFLILFMEELYPGSTKDW